MRDFPVFVAWSVLAGGRLVPSSPFLRLWLGFDLWTVFCALYGHCGGFLGSPLGRVRSIRCFCIAPSAAWVVVASLIVYVFLDSFRFVHGAIQLLTRVQSHVVRAVFLSLLFQM